MKSRLAHGVVFVIVVHGPVPTTDQTDFELVHSTSGTKKVVPFQNMIIYNYIIKITFTRFNLAYISVTTSFLTLRIHNTVYVVTSFTYVTTKTVKLPRRTQ